MKAWAKLFLPTGALIITVFLLYARLQTQNVLASVVAAEQTRLRMAEQRLSEALTHATVEMRVIAGLPAVQDFVAGVDPSATRVASLFASFVREDWSYDQLRMIDGKGMERVRVNRSPSGADIVSSEDLQDRSGTDYVEDALKLLPGQVWVSRMELNVERGVVEVPHRPVLRLAMRVSSGVDRPDYLLVANLRGTVLLKGLRDFVTATEGEIWLLDRDGYWLMHPDPRVAWGRQLDSSSNLRTRLPALASEMNAGSGVTFLDGTMYVHQRIEPLSHQAREGLVSQAPMLDLVSRTPAERLPSALPIDLWLPMFLVLLIAGIGAALLAQQRLRSARAEMRERALLAESARANELRSWIKEHLYQLSLKIYATRDHESFGAAVLSEIAPTLSLTAACVYAMRDGHARPIAGFGLPARFELRDFAPGEGLVGESIRTREEQRLRPPPPGYLDVSGGAGDGPPADLRILPLWVHGRTVGVLELAFSRLLDAREEEFLRQVLPLLALNLDGLLDRHVGRVTA